MVLEVALIDVFAGSEDAFVASYRQARPILTGTPGCRSVRMTRGIESPSRFVLLVEWDDVAAHEENFRATERFTQWRGLIGVHFANPPVVEHFDDVTSDEAALADASTDDASTADASTDELSRDGGSPAA